MWKGRFTAETADVVLRFSQSLDLDWRLAKCDIIGSIAHARMLGRGEALSKGDCLGCVWVKVRHAKQEFFPIQ